MPKKGLAQGLYCFAAVLVQPGQTLPELGRAGLFDGLTLSLLTYFKFACRVAKVGGRNDSDAQVIRAVANYLEPSLRRRRKAMHDPGLASYAFLLGATSGAKHGLRP